MPFFDTHTHLDYLHDMLHFIKEHKLGKVLNETARSGYATYQKVAFDLAPGITFEVTDSLHNPLAYATVALTPDRKSVV